MIIDFHTHIFGGVYTEKTNPEDFLSMMDRNKIEKSLLLPLDGFFSDFQQDNDLVSDLVAQYPDRFAGLGTIDPRQGEKALREIDRCLDETNLIGFKFHSWLQAFGPLDAEFMRLAEEGNRRKALFFFHDGTPPYSEPFQLAEIAKRFPDLTVVLGHAGLPDLWRESLLAALKHDNIWLCFCGTPQWGMEEITKRMGGERIVWGSDYPAAKAQDVTERIKQIHYLPFSDSVKERILYSNAQQLFRQFDKPVKQ
ncbi:amidohydrolase family protein [Paenibacillus sp. HJGM_3]|uniref:amidohydrolase family protein n=1 Tax=Paenibacillus sp. HJGM_3 TaxID=3379816 RepID=UPI00385AB0E5